MSVINFIKSIYKQTHKRDPRPSQGGSQKAGGEWVELSRVGRTFGPSYVTGDGISGRALSFFPHISISFGVQLRQHIKTKINKNDGGKTSFKELACNQSSRCGNSEKFPKVVGPCAI